MRVSDPAYEPARIIRVFVEALFWLIVIAGMLGGMTAIAALFKRISTGG